MTSNPKPIFPGIRVVSEDLYTFIDRLAGDIVLEPDISSCAMCAMRPGCKQRVNARVCQNAVKAWLLSKAGEYLTHNFRRAS